MYKIVDHADFDAGIREYVVDTLAELDQLDATMGSSALCIENMEIYVKDGQKQWRMIPSSNNSGMADALAAPKTTASYDRVPIIRRNLLGTSPDDFAYAIATQGAAQDTVVLRAYSGSIRANCSEVIGNEIAKQNGADGEVAKNQMLVNYGFFKSQLPITIPYRLPNSGDKLLMKPDHKYYISSDGCKLTNGAGSAYGSFTKTIGDGLITCSSVGYNDGNGTHNGGTGFRAFIISVSGLASSSGNMEVQPGACYIENTSGGVVWVYDEGPAGDFN